MASVNLGKVFDINVNLHYSWFFILALLAWSLASDYFPSEYTGYSITAYWILGIISGVLLFACVLAHELSHSLTAKHHGIDVRGITLFFFGGVANADEEGLDAEKEFQIAIAGPVLSTVLGGLFFLFTLLNPGRFVFPIVDYLFKINLILAAFNMVPGFPLDGGRIFRSVVWKYTGSLRKATRAASVGGKVFGGLMAGVGFIMIFTGGAGLWYILLGGFLYLLADASYKEVLYKEELGSMSIKKVMSDDFVEVDPEDSLETLVEDYIKQGNIKFVVGEKNSYYVLNFDKMKDIDRHNWPVKQVKDIMVEVNPLHEHYDCYKALKLMREQNANLLPVVKNGDFTGVVSLNDLLRTTELIG